MIKNCNNLYEISLCIIDGFMFYFIVCINFVILGLIMVFQDSNVSSYYTISRLSLYACVEGILIVCSCVCI
jgi:hypothetical protein